MKKLFILLTFSLILLTSCEKESDTDIPELSVDQFTVEQVVVNPYIEENLLFSSENHNYYLVYSNTPSYNLSTSTAFSVHIESYNLQTGECKVVSLAFENTFFTVQFSAQNKVFFASECFELNSELYPSSLYCLDEKTQNFAPVLSQDAIYLANTDDIAYFFDFSTGYSLTSVDLSTLQNKFLLNIPDIILESGSVISGELKDNILYIRSSLLDTIISEVLYSTIDSTYTVSKNFKKINFFKTYEQFTAYDPETFEIYTVTDVLFNSFKNGYLYSSTEYLDGNKVVISSYNTQELSPVFAGADFITEYANSLLEEHLYSASFGSLSYSDYAITDYTREDDENGLTTFTYNYLYKPTDRYSTILNNYTSSSNNPEYKNGTFTLSAYYLINSYVINHSFDDVLAYDNLSDEKIVTLYQKGNIVYESSRTLESYAENATATYSSGEHIYVYNTIDSTASDITKTSYNSFFLDVFENKLFLTSTKSPSFQGYNCHQISYINLNDNSYTLLEPTVSIFAIKDNLAYYVDSNNMVGFFDYSNLSFTEICEFEEKSDFTNGAIGYIKDDILYVKMLGSSADYQQINLTS